MRHACRRWVHFAALACGLLALGACSPRYAIYETVSAEVDFDLTGAYGTRDSVLSVYYEFWSPTGAPWVTVRNETDRLVLLDLKRSGGSVGDLDFRFDARRLASLDDLDYRDRFRDGTLTSRRDAPMLELPPGRWVGFELPGLAIKRCGRGQRQFAPRHCASLLYVIADDAGAGLHRVAHGFDAAEVEALKEADFERYQRRDPGDNEYFVDTHARNPAAQPNTWLTVLDILVSVVLF